MAVIRNVRGVHTKGVFLYTTASYSLSILYFLFSYLFLFPFYLSIFLVIFLRLFPLNLPGEEALSILEHSAF